MNYYKSALKAFHSHYKKRLSGTSIKKSERGKGLLIASILSQDLKDDNEPRMYLHKEPVDQVIILAHGLSDSPYYMTAIAKEFFYAGANVIIPLMPAHGLKQPDGHMEDLKMDTKWKEEIDTVVEIASIIGHNISLGGFSSGGALCYNKILRDPELINGALFLFAAAIDVRLISDLGQSRFVSMLAKISDGHTKGYGMDPFKYPKLPLFAALELGQIINQNEELSQGLRISQPVFAAHAVDDKTAKLSAIKNLIHKHTETGILYTIYNGMAHAELPLKEDIELDDKYEDGKAAYANQDFDIMMESCLSFYQKYVVDSYDA